jgi:hypothetical protein
MRHRRMYLALAVGALLVLAGGYAIAGAQNFGGGGGDNGPGNPGREERVHAELNSFQEVPSVVTTGFGEFEAIVDDESQTITYRLTYAALQAPATAAHIHLAQRSVNGPVVAFLCGGQDKPPCPPAGGTVTGVIDPTDVTGPITQGIEPGDMPDFIRAIRAGHTYANVHTRTVTDPTFIQGFPGGEIRGQINDRDQMEFVR